MNDLDTEDQTVFDLCRAPQDSHTLGQLRQAIGQARGEELLSALIELERQTLDEGPAIEKTMIILEQVLDVDSSVGGYFMAKLYERASDLFMHDVCDHIELSIERNGSLELASAIENVANSEQDEQLRRRYLSWASTLRKHPVVPPSAG